MKVATMIADGGREAVLWFEDGIYPIRAINGRLGTDWPDQVDLLLESGRLEELGQWADSDFEGTACGSERLPSMGIRFGAPFSPRGKIWGIGLNYREHAGDLDESVPEGLPGSFMKPTTTVIGPGDTIRIPRMSERTTAEAELGVIIGKTCRNVPREDWLSVVAGFTTIIDMTAEDILRRNPRFLTLCKSFDTFFAFGPVLATPDEIEDVLSVPVTTTHNGASHASNVVANMTFPPDYLVSLHSEVMTLHPGDIISTGTPGAVPIAHGDAVSCQIPGFPDLTCPVVDEKS